jgi:uncharacterized protein (TIGR03083 family)
MTVFDDLGAEQDRLGDLLAGLDDAQWAAPSLAQGWTVRDVMVHLAQTEEMALARISGDKLAPYRAEIEGRLRRAAAQARKNGAIDLYLPVQLRGGLPVPASFVVSEGAIPTSSEAEPGQIVSYLVAESTDGAPVTVDGVTGARSEQAAGPDPDQGIGYGSRRVDYVLPIPGAGGRWLLFAFSTLGAGDPGDQVARMLVQLFDAMMSTFRWATV